MQLIVKWIAITLRYLYYIQHIVVQSYQRYMKAIKNCTINLMKSEHGAMALRYSFIMHRPRQRAARELTLRERMLRSHNFYVHLCSSKL